MLRVCFVDLKNCLLSNHKLSAPSHRRGLGLALQGHTDCVHTNFFWGLQSSMVFSWVVVHPTWWCAELCLTHVSVWCHSITPGTATLVVDKKCWECLILILKCHYIYCMARLAAEAEELKHRGCELSVAWHLCAPLQCWVIVGTNILLVRYLNWLLHWSWNERWPNLWLAAGL